MFRDITKHQIAIWGPKSYSNLCNDQATFAMSSVWDMIEWYYSSFLKDCNRTGPLEEWPGDYEKSEGFRMRSTARTMAYINQVCLLEGIVERCYRKMVNLGNHFFSSAIKIDEEKISNLREGLELAFEYRNKFTAHTAYGSPVGNDNPTSEATSLLRAQGGNAPHKNLKAFHLGGTQVVVGDHQHTALVRRFGLYEFHPIAKKHFKEWEAMICEALDHYGLECPLESDGCKLVRFADRE